MVLHLGGSHNPVRQLILPESDPSPKDMVEINIDEDPGVKGAIKHNLDFTPWPVRHNCFDEVHAYEVLEHMGEQGNIHSFFNTFREIWTVLKPGGILCASTPDYRSMWAFGDPDHKRVINHGTITFLIKEKYDLGLRPVYKHLVEPYWWSLEHSNYDDERYWFVLKKLVLDKVPSPVVG